MDIDADDRNGQVGAAVAKATASGGLTLAQLPHAPKTPRRPRQRLRALGHLVRPCGDGGALSCSRGRQRVPGPLRARWIAEGPRRHLVAGRPQLGVAIRFGTKSLHSTHDPLGGSRWEPASRGLELRLVMLPSSAACPQAFLSCPAVTNTAGREPPPEAVGRGSEATASPDATRPAQDGEAINAQRPAGVWADFRHRVLARLSAARRAQADFPPGPS